MGIEEHFEAEDGQEGPSNRSFGLTVGGILLAIAAYRTYSGGLDTINWILSSIGGVLFLLGLLLPATLTAPNRLWMGLGRLLFSVVNPVIMLLMYAVCVVPVGLGMRLFGYDPLERRFDAAKKSYWVEKAPSDMDDPMKHQF